jgi:hypothetical protein
MEYGKDSMSQLIQLAKKQAVKMQAISIPGFAISESNADDYLINFEGHDKRSVFIMVKKRIVLELYEIMKKHFEKPIDNVPCVIDEFEVQRLADNIRNSDTTVAKDGK